MYHVCFYYDLSEVLHNFVKKPLTKVLFLSCISNVWLLIRSAKHKLIVRITAREEATNDLPR
jgi:hypothetical protein